MSILHHVIIERAFCYVNVEINCYPPRGWDGKAIQKQDVLFGLRCADGSPFGKGRGNPIPVSMQPDGGAAKGSKH